MERFNFLNIHGAEWLNVSILAEDAPSAIKKFYNMWGGQAKYILTKGEPVRAMQTVI